jgi:SAM-dependent methyltransferase
MTEAAGRPGSTTVAMFRLITGFWVSQTVGVAAALGIADQFEGEPRDGDDLARAVGVDPDALQRLLRMLASLGVFAEVAPGTFRQTPLSETLRSGGPGSLRAYAMMQCAPGRWLPWGRLLDCIRSGRPMAREALGMEHFTYYAQHPDEAEFFNAGMAELSVWAAGEVLRVYDFSGARVVADVGGGHGSLLAAILRAVPGARGILFELPRVIATARPGIAAQGLTERCELVAGDFFEAVPEGADLHLLKLVVHNWDDADAARLLRNCHRALGPNGKLVLVEMIVPSDNRPNEAQAMDLNMLVNCGGRERTEAEYRRLLAATGFRMERAIPTQTPFYVIEATRS